MEEGKKNTNTKGRLATLDATGIAWIVHNIENSHNSAQGMLYVPPDYVFKKWVDEDAKATLTRRNLALVLQPLNDEHHKKVRTTINATLLSRPQQQAYSGAKA